MSVVVVICRSRLSSSIIVESSKLNDSFDNVECCFDIVAVLATMLPVYATMFCFLATMSNEISSFRLSRYKLNMFHLFRFCRKDEISFHIVAKKQNIVAETGNIVAKTATMSKQHSTLSKESKFYDKRSTLLPFVATKSNVASTKSNVASTLLLVWMRLKGIRKCYQLSAADDGRLFITRSVRSSTLGVTQRVARLHLRQPRSVTIYFHLSKRSERTTAVAVPISTDFHATTRISRQCNCSADAART